MVGRFFVVVSVICTLRFGLNVEVPHLTCAFGANKESPTPLYIFGAGDKVDLDNSIESFEFESSRVVLYVNILSHDLRGQIFRQVIMDIEHTSLR